MRGLVRTGVRESRVVTLEPPELEPGTALVRIRACGVCGSDLHTYRRGEPQPRPPYWWGHEAAGEVVALRPHADEAPRVQVGDLVALDPALGRACGACHWCLEGAPNHCERKREGEGWMGAYAGYALRDVRGLFPVPPGMAPAEAALAEPVAVAVHAVRLARMPAGARVVVLGAGTIGLVTVAVARALGARDVLVTARHAHQATLAEAMGASAVLPEDPAEAGRGVRAATDGEGADLVIETVGGAAPTVEQALTLVSRRGTVAVLGLFEHPVALDTGKALQREVTLCFPLTYGAFDGRHDFQVAIDLLASHAAPFGRLISHRFSLEEGPQALRTADDKHTGAVKVMIEP